MISATSRIARKYLLRSFATIVHKEEFEYLSLKYALKGKYAEFGPDIDYPEAWGGPHYPGDNVVTKMRDFVQFSEVWGIHSRFWWRTFIRLKSGSKEIIPLTFLLDTASPFEVLLSADSEAALKEHKLVEDSGSGESELGAVENDPYIGSFLAPKWKGIKAFRTPSKAGKGKVNILGAKLIAESGGIKVIPETGQILFMTKELI